MSDPFKLPFAETLFNNKYAHAGAETWDKLADVLVDNVCSNIIPYKDDLDYIKKCIREMKFIPGGRYLYYANRTNRFWNNCFSGETRVLTDSGWMSLEKLYSQHHRVDKQPKLLSPVDGKYKGVDIYCHGVQAINKITFVPVRGRSKITYTVHATPDHKWPLVYYGSGPNFTENLSVGDVVPANTFSLDDSDVGFLHGFMFGDGTRKGQLRLCGPKADKYLGRLSDAGDVTVTYPDFADGDPMIYAPHKIEWKSLPSLDTHSPGYIASFIEGWTAADSHDDRMLASVDRDALQWFREHAPFAGIVISGETREQIRDVNIGKYYYQEHSIFVQNYSRGSRWEGFKVKSIEPAGVEKVYCPLEPEHNRFVLEYGIDTYNCFLLRAEEDTREDWANLSWKSESCLMTGGGIGIDYSVYRGEGEPLKGTGGVASGPIPKMYMINEIGRNVIQGGSRRSAIYASLNWKHPDIHKFIHTKDWSKQIVAGTGGLSVADLKMANFNYPAPLDMTNISTNYDNAWLRLSQTGDMGSVFKANVESAMRTGEPGFSFNFGDKEDETLRNAPVSGDTRVLTTDGYKFVSEIVDEPITVWTGKQWTNTVFRETGNNVETITVYLSNGRSITCDPTHPFIAKHYIGKGAKKEILTERINAEDLEEGQKILSDLPQSDDIRDFDPQYYTYGFIFGDGSLRDERFDLSYFVEDKKPCWDICHSAIANSVVTGNRMYGRIHASSKSDMLSRLMHYDHSFIAGWFDADGCYTRDLLRLSSSNVENLYSLSEALDYFGIQSVVRADGWSGYKPGSRSYTLNVLAGSIQRFGDIIPTQRLRIAAHKPYRDSEIRVVSVEPSGRIENVYCCDVGVDEHSFMAAGVLVSNCTEVTSSDDSDVCNLGSVNMARIETLSEFESVVAAGTLFLLCGTLGAQVPYDKVYSVREKNRRLGLGLMGIHEWLLRRGYRYQVVPELHKWLHHYKVFSDITAKQGAQKLGVSEPVAVRAIAPTGTIGNLASTTTGIEPVYSVAYKRRYLKGGSEWHYQYVLDETANHLINTYDIDPSDIETSSDLATDYERRIKFQADVQDYVDMAISSTINLPAFGTEFNNEDMVDEFAACLAAYAPRLRGFTCYPDGSRGGQPLTAVPYHEAHGHTGKEYVETPDICSITGKGGVCGV